MIVKAKNFDLQQIADSGQCFRMKRLEADIFINIAGGKILLMRQIEENEFYFSCTEQEYKDFWENYFDLDKDYEKLGQIVKILADKDNNERIEKAVEFGSGIRMLSQEFWEASVSYIISQNNRIPRIKQAVQNLCELAGETITLEDEYTGIKITDKAFPCPMALMAVPDQILYDYAFFYRLEYLQDFVERIKNGILNPLELYKADYELAYMALTDVKGIGPKVADCICLYGLQKPEAFPVDTWVKKTLLKWHGNEEKYKGLSKGKALKQIMTDHYDIYGVYKGLAQQYLFYYERMKDKDEK